MRKIIDDRGRFFGFISVIDVIFAVVVIILAIAVYTKFNVLESPIIASNTVTVDYTVRIPGIRSSNVKHLRPGDKLYLLEVNTYIGTIIDVDVQDAESVEFLVDGTYAVAKVWDRYDVILTVETQCSYSNGRYYAERTFELNTNAEHWLCTKYNQLNGTIMTIAAA